MSLVEMFEKDERFQLRKQQSINEREFCKEFAIKLRENYKSEGTINFMFVNKAFIQNDDQIYDLCKKIYNKKEYSSPQRAKVDSVLKRWTRVNDDDDAKNIKKMCL